MIIFFIVGVALTCFGQSNNTTVSSKVTIQSNFSFQAIKAFQESAVLKIEDYYDYLELYSNTATSDTLRKQLKGTIYNLFADQQPKVVDFTSSDNTPIALNKLLDKIKKKNYTFKLTDTQSSIVAADFWTTKYNLEIFEGNQRCILEVFSKVIFRPVEKQFGSNSKEVWVLFLGNME